MDTRDILISARARLGPVVALVRRVSGEPTVACEIRDKWLMPTPTAALSVVRLRAGLAVCYHPGRVMAQESDVALMREALASLENVRSVPITGRGKVGRA